jgi:hypothetical protein
MGGGSSIANFEKERFLNSALGEKPLGSNGLSVSILTFTVAYTPA